MLHYLERTEINLKQWDACVANSREQVIYAYSWFLDVVCHRWAGLVEKQGERYVSVFPVPYRQLLGLRRLDQPFFTQQLGLFTTSHSRHRQPLEYLALVDTCFSDIPNLQLNIANTPALFKSPPGFILRPRVTYHLSLAAPYPVLCQHYSTNLKRNLKKARQAGYTVSTARSPGPMLQLFRQTKGKEIPELKPKDYGTLERLYGEAQARGQALLLEVRQGPELVAGGFFLVEGGLLIYLFGATSAAGRQAGAMALLLDQLVRERAGSGEVLDFEGSDLPGIARFYASFGAQPQTYVSLEKQNKPWYIRWIK